MANPLLHQKYFNFGSSYEIRVLEVFDQKYCLFVIC